MAASVSLPVYKRRASLFYDDEEQKTPAAKSTPLSFYEKRLSVEIKEWNQVITSGVEDPRKVLVKADKSCLTETERQFLESAPDFDEIIETSNAYCKKMEFFLEVLDKKREQEDVKINDADSFINTKMDEAINVIVHKIPDTIIY